MKKRILAVLLILVMLVSLTGCSGLKYHKAMDLFEDGDYTEAREIFAELEDYEDSAEMVNACDYRMAVAAFERGDYDEAISRFEALGDYKDSADYVHKANRTKLHAFIEENGFLSEDGTMRIVEGVYTAENNNKDYIIYLATDDDVPGKVILFSGTQTNVPGVVTFDYTFFIAVPFEGELADYIYEMSMKIAVSGNGGTTDAERTGQIVISECSGEDTLDIATYEEYSVDIYGNESYSDDMANAPSEDMQTHYMNTMAGVRQVLDECGCGITLEDMGFAF